MPLFRKHCELRVGTLGLKMTHVAPTHPLVPAQLSRHALKLVCVLFDNSMDCPAGEPISVPHSLRNWTEETDEVYVELLTRGHPAVSTITVALAGCADDVAVERLWTLLLLS
jgi:hypothetical protein